MLTFILQEFEQTGRRDSSDLRLLGQRQRQAPTLAEGKRWLTAMLEERRLPAERFYRFEAPDCSTDVRQGFRLNIAFYLFADGRLCPVRIWQHEGERPRSERGSEWTVDFEGIPGWALIASVEPRWRACKCVRTERSWIGRSKRDWHLRDCWLPVPDTARRDHAA